MKFTRLQIITHLGALLPLGFLVWDALTRDLTVNPIQEATLRTGKTALVLLVLSLASRPLSTVTDYPQILRLRRPLGLYAFGYAALHFFIFVGLDYGFQWGLIREAIFEKRYAFAGLAAFLILLPMAVTSTRGWQRRLGKRWKRLHQLVYLAAILAVVHYVWLVKADIRQPLVFGLVVLALLLLRLPALRRWVSGKRFRGLGRRRREALKGRALPQETAK